jgi:hypothetical protein
MELYGQAVRRAGDLTGLCVSSSCRRTMNCKHIFSSLEPSAQSLNSCGGVNDPESSSRHHVSIRRLCSLPSAILRRRGCDADLDIHKSTGDSTQVDHSVFPSCNCTLVDVRIFFHDSNGASHVLCFGVSGARYDPIDNGG